ncbi:hypothetical protein SS50377_26112 [Spironucleus salmonicida]|uniref:Uncharacterized protein n=1 Tax=Spironucleus salmonicida TaxID=348837 RepID=A0A9P8RWX2_9EUKA|nr:hypothetical protein SS50377_26106 [Spironucleus salmonicida]KAH0571912.1 hypothetical protein SS50377_26112 [Spironucleus salmonicida]
MRPRNTLRKFHRLVPPDTTLPIFLRPVDDTSIAAAFHRRQSSYQDAYPPGLVGGGVQFPAIPPRKALPSSLTGSDVPAVSLDRASYPTSTQHATVDTQVELELPQPHPQAPDRAMAFSRHYVRRSAGQVCGGGQRWQ